jgi:hypothetical protein
LTVNADGVGTVRTPTVQIRAHEGVGHVHHRETGRDRLVRRTVDREVAGIQLVIKARERALMRRHAGLRLECDEYAADGSFDRSRERPKGGTFEPSRRTP